MQYQHQIEEQERVLTFSGSITLKEIVVLQKSIPDMTAVERGLFSADAEPHQSLDALCRLFKNAFLAKSEGG